MPAPGASAALVPGELRGYRQFHRLPDGLYPLVHRAGGPWDGRLEHAVCAAGEDHAAPAADCRCGLYAWYLPGGATVVLGGWNAVIAARGRCILGDRGFRAASARIEAVALPPTVRWWPGAARRTRDSLAARYPGTRVHRSTRAMIRAHPPQDLAALGVRPPADRSRGYRAALVVLLVAFTAAGYSLAVLPREAVSAVAAQWWPAVIVVVLAWQCALVWLVTRLISEQAPHVEPSPPA